MKKLIIMFVGLLVIIGQIKANPTSENQRIQELVDSLTRQEMSNNAYPQYTIMVVLEKENIPASAGGMCGPLFSRIVSGLCL